MKRSSVLFFLLIVGTAPAQIRVVDGARVKVDSTAFLIAEQHLDISSASGLHNAGTVAIKGDLRNQGSLVNAPGARVRFFGANESRLQAGGASLYHLELTKADSRLRLEDTLRLEGNLIFGLEGNWLLAGNYDILLGIQAGIQNAGSRNFVVTSGRGRLWKTGVGPSGFVYPVGYDEQSYLPATLSQTGAIDELGVRSLKAVHKEGLSGLPYTTGAVNATWDLAERQAGGSDIALTLQWTGEDELPEFDRQNCAVSYFTQTSWDGQTTHLGKAQGNDPFTRLRTHITALGLFAVTGAPLINGVRNALSLPGSLQVYPNPADDGFTVEANIGILKAQSGNLYLFDTAGRLIQVQKTAEISGSRNWHFSTLSLPAGTYRLEWRDTARRLLALPVPVAVVH